MKTVKIFDTTLRDGEQSPGVNFTLQEKVMIAKQLEKLGVDVIEAGFPVSSQGNHDAVKEIAKQVRTPIICGLSRTVKKDIDAAWSAIKDAAHPRIHTFVATSNIHMDHKLKKSPEEIKAMVKEQVSYACSLCSDVEFSPEDASRTDLDFMCEVIAIAIKAGATTINIPDTVGYAQPEEFGKRIAYVQQKVPQIKDVTISVHCHDDLGLSVANSLEAIRQGATQVEGTLTGIGERAGNTALEEVIMALKTRKEYYQAQTNINSKEIFRTSQLISRLSGMIIQKNKAIVGGNAFAHESGIHQHGVIAHKKTYEILSAQEVGWQGEHIRIGKLSGKHAVESVLKEEGLELSKDQVVSVITKVKELGDKEKNIERADIIAIGMDVLGSTNQQEEIISLEDIKITTGNNTTAHAKVKLKVDGTTKQGEADGVGPVDAATKAIKNVLGQSLNLKEYNLKAITGGTDALAEVVITFEDADKRVYRSDAVNQDVIMASVEAVIKGANKVLGFTRRNK